MDALSIQELSRRIGPRTKEQALFLRYYLDADAAAYNATKAAKMAGYSERSAHAIGHELKNKPHIAASIALHLLCYSIPCRMRSDRGFNPREYFEREVAKCLNGA